MSELSWAATVRLVYERASNCCEYCQTCQSVCGQAMHVEHIEPGAGDQPENLCLSCPSCNLSKAKATSALDPESGNRVMLFNPRKQLWRDHFEWIDGGVRIKGRTSTGRATVERLKMNIERIATARQVWMMAGKHPPVSSRG